MRRFGQYAAIGGPGPRHPGLHPGEQLLISTVIRLWAEQMRNCGLIPGSAKIFSSGLQCANQRQI